MKLKLDLSSNTIEYLDKEPFIQGYSSTQNKIEVYCTANTITNIKVAYSMPNGRSTIALSNNASESNVSYNDVEYPVKYTFNIPNQVTANDGQLMITFVVTTSDGVSKFNALNTIIKSTEFESLIEAASDNDLISEVEAQSDAIGQLQQTMPKKIGIDTFGSVKVDELPETGETGIIYYVKIEDEEVYDVYYWNALTTAFVFLGTTSCGLYTTEDGQAFEEEVNDRLDQQDETIANINALNPSGTDTSTNILAFTTNKGIYIGTDTGNWYYWDAVNNEYKSGGTYLSTSNVITHGINQLKDENNNNLYPNTYDINFIRFDKYGLQGANINTLNTGLPYYGNSNLARASYTKYLTINGVPTGRTLRIYKVDTLSESLSGKGTVINNGDTITIEKNKYYKFTLDGDVDNQAINCNTIYYNEVVADVNTLNRLNNYVMQGYIVFNKYGLQGTNINVLNTGLPYYGHSDLFRSKFNFSITAYGIPNGRTMRIYAVDTQTESISGKGTILTNGTTVNISKDKWYRYTIDGDSTTPATSITSIYLDIEPLEANKWYGKTFGFIGDSITAGQFSTKSYAQYMRDELGITISNQAVPGYTLLQIYGEIDNLPADLDAVFVMGGTNNYKSTGLQGQIGELFKTVDGVKVPNDDNSICGVLNKICIKLKQLYPSALIVLLNPPKSVRGYDYSDDTTAPFNLLDLQEAYRKVSLVNSCMLIDISSECIINSQIEESADIYYTHIWTEQESATMAGQQDLTHPTALGHQEIAKTIISRIK